MHCREGMTDAIYHGQKVEKWERIEEIDTKLGNYLCKIAV